MGESAWGKDRAGLVLSKAIAEFLRGYFSTHQRAQKTIKAYKADLHQFEIFAGRQLQLTGVASETIESWASDLKAQNYSPASLRRKIVALRVFLSYWMRKGLISESPFWRVKLSYGRTTSLPRSLTEREIQTLIATARHSSEIDETDSKSRALTSRSPSYRAARNRAIVEVLFATGMRVGEASGLLVSDYIADENVFKVRGKGGTHRLAFVVDPLALSALHNYMRLRSSLEVKSSALFLNHRGQQLSTQGIANLLSSFTKKGKLERHITPHMLRHTVATLLLRNGVDIRVVQEFLGHASIATTQRYTHVSKDHLRSVLSRQHPSLTFTTNGQRPLFLPHR